MNNKTTKLLYLSLLFLSIIGLIIGSFFDLQISNILYTHQANISLFVSSFNNVTGGIFCLLGGAVIRYGIKKIDNNKIWNLLSIILGSLIIIVSSYIIQDQIFSVNGIFKYYNSNLNLNYIFKFLIGLIYESIFGLIGFFFVYPFINRKNIYLLILLLFCLGVPYGIVTLIKFYSTRPRYRFIISVDNNLFHNWYERFKDYHLYINNGIPKEEFRSFSSGHAVTSGMGLFLLLNLPNYFTKLKGKENLLFIIGLIYLLFVQLTRIICGAHFLSDVCFSIIILVICDSIIYKIFYHKIYEI